MPLFEVERASVTGGLSYDAEESDGPPVQSAWLEEHQRDEQSKPTKAWVIQIDSLEELLELTDREGGLIIRESNKQEYEYEIVIYDDFME